MLSIPECLPKYWLPTSNNTQMIVVENGMHEYHTTNCGGSLDYEITSYS